MIIQNSMPASRDQALHLPNGSARQLPGNVVNTHSCTIWVDTTHSYMARDLLCLSFSAQSRNDLSYMLACLPVKVQWTWCLLESESLLSSSDTPCGQSSVFNNAEVLQSHSVYLEGQKGCKRYRSPTFALYMCVSVPQYLQLSKLIMFDPILVF